MDEAYENLDIPFLENLDETDFEKYLSLVNPESDSYNPLVCFGVHVGWNSFMYDYSHSIEYYLEKKISASYNDAACSYFNIFQQVKEIEIMEYLRENRILSFLILPGNVSKESPYSNYKKLAKYIDAIAGHSSNFICLESKEYSTGRLKTGDMNALKLFYKKLKSSNNNTSIALFGGNVDYCLKHASEDVENIIISESKVSGRNMSGLVIMPEYTSINPEKINTSHSTSLSRHRRAIKKQFSTINSSLYHNSDINIIEKAREAIVKLPKANNIILSEIKKALVESKAPETKIMENLIKTGLNRKCINL